MGSKIIEQTIETIEKIRVRIKIAQSNRKVMPMAGKKNFKFQVDDKIFLKVASMKGVLKLGKKGKLRPRFIRPFEFLERIGVVAY